MNSSREALEKAILAKAMKEPEFMAKLLHDPKGFLKRLAHHEATGEARGLGLWESVVTFKWVQPNLKGLS